MSYQVLIRNNATGEERLYQYDFDWGDSSLFLWTEGNYGCDCNRSLFFRRAVGEKVGCTESVDCGETAFSIPYAIMPDGTRIQIDDQEKPYKS